MISFLASEVWEHDRLAARAVPDEPDAVQALRALGDMPGLEMAKIRVAVDAYVNSVLHDE